MAFPFFGKLVVAAGKWNRSGMERRPPAMIAYKESPVLRFALCTTGGCFSSSLPVVEDDDFINPDDASGVQQWLSGKN